MGRLLTRQIAKEHIDRWTPVKVDVDGFDEGDHVFVQRLDTRTVRLNWDLLKDTDPDNPERIVEMVKIVILSVTDSKGKLLYNAEDFDFIEQWPFAAIAEITRVVQELNGFGRSLKDRAKKSRGNRSAKRSTGSRGKAGASTGGTSNGN